VYIYAIMKKGLDPYTVSPVKLTDSALSRLEDVNQLYKLGLVDIWELGKAIHTILEEEGTDSVNVIVKKVKGP
jgi:hypothetical protein